MMLTPPSITAVVFQAVNPVAQATNPPAPRISNFPDLQGIDFTNRGIERGMDEEAANEESGEGDEEESVVEANTNAEAPESTNESLNLVEQSTTSTPCATSNSRTSCDSTVIVNEGKRHVRNGAPKVTKDGRTAYYHCSNANCPGSMIMREVYPSGLFNTETVVVPMIDLRKGRKPHTCTVNVNETTSVVVRNIKEEMKAELRNRVVNTTKSSYDLAIEVINYFQNEKYKSKSYIVMICKL